MNTPFEKRICYTLCCCELTAVLSCVSIFYLTFAVYLPSYRQLNAGFSEQTVMCTTLSNLTIENCEVTPGVPSWSSCGEWCLSKSGGSCTQIRVDVRSNGTNVRLEGCETEQEDVSYCDGVDPKEEPAECITGGCANLTGIYNCSMHESSPGVTEALMSARCRDLSTVLTCNLTSTDPGVQCNTKKSCHALTGLYLCKTGFCSRIRPPFKCEKTCNGIKTEGKSIIVRENNVIFTARCKRAVDMTTNEEIWPRDLVSMKSIATAAIAPTDLAAQLTFAATADPQQPPEDDLIPSDNNTTEILADLEETIGDFTNDTSKSTTDTLYSPSPTKQIRPAPLISPEPPLLVMFCTTILDRQQNLTSIQMLDCFNGTLMEPETFGDTTNIVTLVTAHIQNTRMLDPLRKIAPVESDLRILNNAPLYINFEGCVNTLILRECEQFYAQYGVDGSDLRTNARFPCFYRPDYSTDPVDPDANFVILRFDIQRTMMELMLASTIPVSLAVVSCFMLVLCSRVVQVDDESRFYLEMCNKVYKPQTEETLKI